jgi:hypothetical protein
MSDWLELIDELDAWETSSPATFWWRDDDAVEPTEKLDQLFAVAKPLSIALAVIPKRANLALAERVRNCQRITVLQHGWRHENYDAPNSYSEYPGTRSITDVAEEFRNGRERMSELFGEMFLPVFVPPWHGFDDKFLPELKNSKLWSISRGGPRGNAAKSAGVFECNVHADLWDWNTRAFVGVGAAIDQLLMHLRQRRQGLCDREEPTGILTHHLEQDLASCDFIENLAEKTGAHNAAKWLRTSEIFPN